MKNSLLFFLSLFISLNLAAQESSAETAEAEDELVELTKEEEWAWLDAVYKNFSFGVVGTANWFDDFFADNDTDISKDANAMARLMFAWEPRSGNVNEFESRFRVRVKLPNAEEKIDLIISDYDENEQETQLEAARNDDIPYNDDVNLALRWTVPSLDSKLSARVGAGRKAQLFMLGKYQRNFAFSDSVNIRFEPSIYYYHRDGAGARLQMNYENSLSDDSLFRFSNSFTYRDEQKDWIFRHGISYYYQVTDKKAVIYGFSVVGDSKPNYRTEEYQLSTRWRRNALKEWLYFEVEPFLLWRRDEGWDTSPGVALRVQGYFGK